jgi:hypothetical protein
VIIALLVGCRDVGTTVTPLANVDVATVDTPSRPWRRMNLDQLATSMETVSGLAWTEVEDGVTVRVFDELSGSLGKPDYLSSTYEERAPGLLFQKFLDDAAKGVCDEWMEMERVAPASERRFLLNVEPSDTFATNPDGIDRDLAGALLRFHGRVALPGDRVLDPWRTLFARGADAHGDPVDGWRLVCIALFTHPDFYTY